MAYTTLISTAILASHLDDPAWAIFDCRFSLADTGKGRREYLQAHIPGAVYAHLDQGLSGQVVPGVTGRHPLPQVDVLVKTFSRWGISPGVQVVAYDDMGGALAAARLWWLLRWLGHTQAAVLDGGWQAWQRESRLVQDGKEQRAPGVFSLALHPELVANLPDVERASLDPSARLLDVRAYERYLGQNESIDPVAGHIPGARSAPFAGNLAPDGCFLPIEKLRQRYLDLLGDRLPESTIFYCGSGVSAAHGVLAMVHAGLGTPRLYPGSWSEWITDPHRSVAKGNP